MLIPRTFHVSDNPRAIIAFQVYIPVTDHHAQQLNVARFKLIPLQVNTTSNRIHTVQLIREISVTCTYMQYSLFKKKSNFISFPYP